MRFYARKRLKLIDSFVIARLLVSRGDPGESQAPILSPCPLELKILLGAVAADEAKLYPVSIHIPQSAIDSLPTRKPGQDIHDLTYQITGIIR